MELRQSQLSLRDGRFEVRLWRGGSGPSLLYLHGSNGLPRPQPFLESLAGDFDVLAPVHPGWSGSTGLEHLDDILDLAIYYLDFLDELGIARTHIVGHSLGGMLAAEIAALAGAYVDRLVLANPAGLWLDYAPPLDFFTAQQEELQRALFHDPARAAELMPPPPDPDDKEAAGRAMLERQLNLAAAGKFLWPIWDKGLKKRIHRIKAPALLIWGESDGLIPPAYGAEFQRLIPGSRLEIIAQSGHMPMLEQPAEFLRLVRGFLAG